jgi:hypothetical protein
MIHLWPPHWAIVLILWLAVVLCVVISLFPESGDFPIGYGRLLLIERGFEYAITYYFLIDLLRWLVTLAV